MITLRPQCRTKDAIRLAFGLPLASVWSQLAGGLELITGGYRANHGVLETLPFPVLLAGLFAVPIVLAAVAGKLLDVFGPLAVAVVLAILATLGYGGLTIASESLSGMLAGFEIGADVVGAGLMLMMYSVMLAAIDLAQARWLIPLVVVGSTGLSLLIRPLVLSAAVPELAFAIATAALVGALVLVWPLLAGSRWRAARPEDRGTFTLVFRNRYLLRVLLLAAAVELVSAAGGRLTSTAAASHRGGGQGFEATLDAFDQLFLYSNLAGLVILVTALAVFTRRLPAITVVVWMTAGAIVAAATGFLTGGSWVTTVAVTALSSAGSTLLWVAWLSMSAAAVYKGRLAVFAMTGLLLAGMKLAVFAVPEGAAAWLLLGGGTVLVACAAASSAAAPVVHSPQTLEETFE